jgi:hypothetical protein
MRTMIGRGGLIRRNGLGLLTSSNFYVPQVNLPGSMASFVTPPARHRGAVGVGEKVVELFEYLLGSSNKTVRPCYPVKAPMAAPGAERSERFNLRIEVHRA